MSKVAFSVSRPFEELLVVLADSSFQRRCINTGAFLGGSVIAAVKTNIERRPNYSLMLEAAQKPQPCKPQCTALAQSPSGRFLVTANTGGSLQHWETYSCPDMITGVSPMQEFRGHYMAVRPASQKVAVKDVSISHCCFTNAGDRVISVGGDAIFLWNFAGCDVGSSEPSFGDCEDDRLPVAPHHCMNLLSEAYANTTESPEDTEEKDEFALLSEELADCVRVARQVPNEPQCNSCQSAYTLPSEFLPCNSNGFAMLSDELQSPSCTSKRSLYRPATPSRICIDPLETLD